MNLKYELFISKTLEHLDTRYMLSNLFLEIGRNFIKQLVFLYLEICFKKFECYYR